MEKGGAKTRYQWNMDAIRTLKPVSYTHLDVYKRQECENVAGFPKAEAQWEYSYLWRFRSRKDIL